MNIGLVLSGGAARGAFHLGILAYLEDKGIEIQEYSGSSIGAIIACSHASGIESRKILEIFKSKEIKKTLKFNYFKKGLIKIDNNHPILETLLPIKNLEDLEKKVYVNAFDLHTKKMFYYDSGDTHTLCLASSALIPIFKPIYYDGHHFIDGGLVDNMPIKPLENKNLDIYTVDLMPRALKENKKKFSLLKPLKKKIFQRRFDNANYSISNSKVYITNQSLRHVKMYTFNGLDESFDLGYKEACKYF